MFEVVVAVDTGLSIDARSYSVASYEFVGSWLVLREVDGSTNVLALPVSAVEWIRVEDAE